MNKEISDSIIYPEEVVSSAIERIFWNIRDLVYNDVTTIITLLDGGMYLTAHVMERMEQHDCIKTRNIVNKNIKVSSYHGQEHGNLDFEWIPDLDVANKPVILIDDFCDSGYTISEVAKYLKKVHHVSTIYVFILLLRKNRYQPSEYVDQLYAGIEDETDNFYAGCGLDDNSKGRWVPYIYKV